MVLEGSWWDSGETEEGPLSHPILLSARLWDVRCREGDAPLPPSLGKGEPGPSFSFSVNYYSLPASTCGMVLYLQALWARFSVCGCTSLWTSACRC